MTPDNVFRWGFALIISGIGLMIWVLLVGMVIDLANAWSIDRTLRNLRKKP